MNTEGFSAALAARPGDPVPVAPTSEEQQIEQQIKEQSAPKVEKPAAEEDRPEEAPKEKSPFDDLPSEEVEKPAAEEKKPDEQEVDTANWPKKQREAFAAARVAQKRLTEELSKAQEAIKQRDAAIEEAKKTGKPDEATLKELEELRQWRYSEEVEASPEWKQAVADPLTKTFASLKEIAEAMKVDNEELLKATDEPLSWKRNAAIHRLFKAAAEAADSPADPVEVQAAADAAIQEASKLPSFYAKMDEMRAKAQETWQSLKARTEEQKSQQSKQSEADFLKASEHLLPQLKTKWPSFFKDEATAKSVAEARIDATPEGQALQAQKAALFKPALTELMAARAKIAELEKAVAAWKGSKAAVEDKVATSAKPDDGELDESAFAAALAKR
jgi:colicin import membrane protein